MTDDMALVREYAERNSEEAFATLVSRHVNLVYSVALQQVHDSHLAEEITQAVFIILAQKAKSLSTKTILSGWLYRTAHYASANALKIQQRRQRREQEAYMQSTLNEPESEDAWAQIAPLLSAALAQLGEKDHDAIVLRFFDGKNMSEVGAALGVSENTAKTRVSRAVEKLRTIFLRRGVSLSTVAIAGAISANSVQAAPGALATSITAAAMTKGAAASSSTLTLIKGVLKIMAWTKMKTAIVAGIGLLLAAGTATVAVKEIAAHRHEKFPPTPRTTPETKSIKGQFIGRAQLVDAGNTTPEAAFESRYWARSRGDYDAVIAATAPEAVDGAKAWMGEKSQFRTGSKEEFASFIGMQFLARKDLAEDRVELKYHFIFTGRRETKIVQMVKINGGWFSGATRAHDASWDAGSQPEPQS